MSDTDNGVHLASRKRFFWKVLDLALVLVVAITSQALAGNNPYLVKDINTSPSSTASTSGNLVTVGSTTFFSGKGYNEAYTNPSGDTIIHGSLTISNGLIAMDKIRFK